jgi:hypothetical protein
MTTAWLAAGATYQFFRRKARIAFLAFMIYAALC